MHENGEQQQQQKKTIAANDVYCLGSLAGGIEGGPRRRSCYNIDINIMTVIPN